MEMKRQPKVPLTVLALIETLAVEWRDVVFHLDAQEFLMLDDHCCQVDSRNRLSRNCSIVLPTPSYNVLTVFNVYIFIYPILYIYIYIYSIINRFTCLDYQSHPGRIDMGGCPDLK